MPDYALFIEIPKLPGTREDIIIAERILRENGYAVLYGAIRDRDVSGLLVFCGSENEKDGIEKLLGGSEVRYMASEFSKPVHLLSAEQDIKKAHQLALYEEHDRNVERKLRELKGLRHVEIREHKEGYNQVTLFFQHVPVTDDTARYFKGPREFGDFVRYISFGADGNDGLPQDAVDLIKSEYPTLISMGYRDIDLLSRRFFIRNAEERGEKRPISFYFFVSAEELMPLPEKAEKA